MIHNYNGGPAEIINLYELGVLDTTNVTDYLMCVEMGDLAPCKAAASNVLSLRGVYYQPISSNYFGLTFRFREYHILNITNGLTTLSLHFDALSSAENYILINNSSNASDLVIINGGFAFNGTQVDYSLFPQDGVVVPAQKAVELSYAAFDNTIVSHGILTVSNIFSVTVTP